MKVKVIGAGLAGCEAVWQLVKQGIDVDLYEMKSGKVFTGTIQMKILRNLCVQTL